MNLVATQTESSEILYCSFCSKGAGVYTSCTYCHYDQVDMYIKRYVKYGSGVIDEVRKNRAVLWSFLNHLNRMGLITYDVFKEQWQIKRTYVKIQPWYMRIKIYLKKVIPW